MCSDHSGSRELAANVWLKGQAEGASSATRSVS